MVDLTEFDNLADKQIKAGGVKMSFASVLAIITFVSTVVAGLYGGFVMYQKVEEVAGLDLGEYQQQMDLMDAQVQQTVEYTRDIKNNLRDDLLRVEQQADRVESLVRKTEEKVRSMIDAADLRFESQRERLRSNQDAEMKDLEDKLMGKLQRALDNPLSD
jgi:type II secretory pathway pseudopilin PulG